VSSRNWTPAEIVATQAVPRTEARDLCLNLPLLRFEAREIAVAICKRTKMSVTSVPIEHPRSAALISARR
jgi:hypothetical protein